MSSKEKFIEYMNKYKELVEIEEKIDSTMKLLCEDFNNFSFR